MDGWMTSEVNGVMDERKRVTVATNSAFLPLPALWRGSARQDRSAGPSRPVVHAFCALPAMAQLTSKVGSAKWSARWRLLTSRRARTAWPSRGERGDPGWWGGWSGVWWWGLLRKRECTVVVISRSSKVLMVLFSCQLSKLVGVVHVGLLVSASLTVARTETVHHRQAIISTRHHTTHHPHSPRRSLQSCSPFTMYGRCTVQVSTHPLHTAKSSSKLTSEEYRPRASIVSSAGRIMSFQASRRLNSIINKKIGISRTQRVKNNTGQRRKQHKTTRN